MEKPDFEQIASFRSDITDHSMFLGFRSGCEHVWNTHVVPLGLKNANLEDWNRELIEKLKASESENKSLREEIESLKIELSDEIQNNQNLTLYCQELELSNNSLKNSIK